MAINSVSNLDIKKLKEEGYLVYKNLLNSEEIKQGQSCFKNQKIYYPELEKLNKLYLEKVSEKIELDLISMKYRASNNNNSTDAGMYHRDIYVFQPEKQIQVYTCLLYLDEAFLEIIPQSHSKPIMSKMEAIKMYCHKKKINIFPGTIIIFHSSLIHRGIFYKKSPNRRLIQQFTCIDKSQIADMESKILHTPCSPQGRKTTAFLGQKISKSQKISTFMNYFIYINVAQGYSYHYNLPGKIKEPNILCISPETNQNRIIPKDDDLDINNKYVVNPEVEIHDIKKKYWKTFNFYTHYAFYLKILLVLVLVLVLVMILTYYLLLC